MILNRWCQAITSTASHHWHHYTPTPTPCLHRYFSVIRPHALGESTEDVSIGDHCQLQHSFSTQDGLTFAELSGDHNPIHKQPSSLFPYPIVHGMLTASLFTRLFGTLLPGAVYLDQTLNFESPIRYQQSLTARITIKDMEYKRKGTILTCETVIINDTEHRLALTGQAKVLLPSTTINVV